MSNIPRDSIRDLTVDTLVNDFIGFDNKHVGKKSIGGSPDLSQGKQETSQPKNNPDNRVRNNSNVDRPKDTVKSLSTKAKTYLKQAGKLKKGSPPPHDLLPHITEVKKNSTNFVQTMLGGESQVYRPQQSVRSRAGAGHGALRREART